MAHSDHTSDAEPEVAAQDVTRDPVCGMTVDPTADTPGFEHDGHHYHFCSEGCREKFRTDPNAYLTATDPVCGMQVEMRADAGLWRRDLLVLFGQLRDEVRRRLLVLRFRECR